MTQPKMCGLSVPAYRPPGPTRGQPWRVARFMWWAAARQASHWMSMKFTCLTAKAPQKAPGSRAALPEGRCAMGVTSVAELDPGGGGYQQRKRRLAVSGICCSNQQLESIGYARFRNLVASWGSSVGYLCLCPGGKPAASLPPQPGPTRRFIPSRSLSSGRAKKLNMGQARVLMYSCAVDHPPTLPCSPLTGENYRFSW